MTTLEHVNHCFKMIDNIMHFFIQDVVNTFVDLSITPERIWEIWTECNGSIGRFRDVIPDDVKVRFNNWVVGMLNEQNVVLNVTVVTQAYELKSQGRFDSKGMRAINYCRKPGGTSLSEYGKSVTPVVQTPQQVQALQVQRQLQSPVPSFSVMSRRTGGKF